MVFSFFSFAFNRFTIAYRAFRRTVSRDVSGLAGCNDRQAVSKFIVDHFAQYNIHEVQFIGTVLTFAAEASKQQVLSHQVININGILCAVLGDGPRAQNVLVYNYPVEGNEELICRKLGVCGVIKNISFCHWTHLKNVSDGVRVVQMVRSAAIPCHVPIGDFQVKIAYAGQHQVSDLCKASGHIAQARPLQGKCFLCGLEGHLSHNCPQRAAASVSATSQKVDLRDNQLDELSQTQSSLARVLAGVPPCFAW